MSHVPALGLVAFLVVSLLAPGARVADIPSISSLSPSSAVIGANGVTLTVNGAGFARTSVVRWKGVDRVTAYVSASRLTATIPAADLGVLGAAQITVFTQGGNGGSSNVATFTVGNPVPTITSLTPATAAYQGAPLTMVVSGTNFVSGASVRWNGVSRQTTFESPSRMTIPVLASDLGSVASVKITAFNPAPLGGVSASFPFAVALATPTIASLSPASRAVGPSRGFTLVVDGRNFPSSSTVRWNGVARATTVVSPTRLSALIADSDVDSAGTAQIAVQATAPGAVAQESAPITYSLPHPAPVMYLASRSVLVLGAPTTLTVNGSGFGPFTVVTLNGRPTGVRYVDYNRLAGPMEARSPDTLGAAVLTIANPPPGGGAIVHNMTIRERPVLTSLAPQNVFRGGAAFVLTVKGDRFYPSMTIRWKGGDRPTTWISRTEMRASIAAGDLLVGGDAEVRVWDPLSGYTNALRVTALEQMITIP